MRFLRERLLSPVRLLRRILGMNLGLLDRSFRVVAYPLGRTIHCLVRSRVGPARTTKWRRLRIRRGTTDWLTFEQVFVNEDYRLSRLPRWPELEAIYARIVADGRCPLIVDCGANAGLSTVYFEELFPEALIVALEPEASNFEVLRRMVGESERTICLKAAISNVDGRVRLADPGRGHWGFRTEPSCGPDPDHATVDAFSFQTVLDRAAKRASVEPFLAKIDIEGHERELFSSNTEWVDGFPLLVVELHDWMLPGTASSRSFLSTVASLDRDLVFAGENAFSIRNRAR